MEGERKGKGKGNGKGKRRETSKVRTVAYALSLSLSLSHEDGGILAPGSFRSYMFVLFPPLLSDRITSAL